MNKSIFNCFLLPAAVTSALLLSATSVKAQNQSPDTIRVYYLDLGKKFADALYQLDSK